MSVIERLGNKKASLYAAIERRYACSHDIRDLRRRIIKDGRIAYYRQCVRCGHAGQAVSAKTACREVADSPIPDFDNEAESRWANAKSSEYSYAADEITQEFWLVYQDYLASAQWKAKRAQVLQRAKGTCEICEQDLAVNVHHETYEHLCCEPLEELKAVCQLCHDYLHGKVEL